MNPGELIDLGDESREVVFLTISGCILIKRRDKTPLTCTRMIIMPL